MDTEQKASDILVWLKARNVPSWYDNTKAIEGICKYICSSNGKTKTPSSSQIASVVKNHAILREHNDKLVLPKASQYRKPVRNFYDNDGLYFYLKYNDKYNERYVTLDPIPSIVELPEASKLTVLPLVPFEVQVPIPSIVKLPEASKLTVLPSVPLEVQVPIPSIVELPEASNFPLILTNTNEPSVVSPPKPHKCITVISNKTVCGIPTATQHCGRHKPNKIVGMTVSSLSKDPMSIPSIVVLPEASKLLISPLEPLEAFLQDEEEIPLQKHKRKHPRKYMIVDDEDEEQEVQVPRRSTRVQPYSKVVFEYDDEEQEVYEIKEIIGIQNNPISGEVQYLISWKGYTSKSNSWEPKENLVGADCPKLINKFIRNNKI